MIANRSDRPRKNLANNSAGINTWQLDRLPVAHADERMRFRGAAYIVARVRFTRTQQGRLWICSLFPVSVSKKRGRQN
jgi:hypothetical protein